MKTDMFSSLKVIHGAARSTALSVAASMVIAAAFATPVSTFAATPATPATKAKTSKHAKAAKKPAAATASKVSGKKAVNGAAAKTVAAAGDDAPRASVKRKRVTYTSNGRHHSVVRRVAYEPRPPTVGQAFGLHETPDALMLRSSVAYVVDQNSGESLFDKNSRAVVPIASITKLMTGLLISQARLPMDEPITITQEDVDMEKFSSSRLRVGTTLTRGELLHLALMSSENRAAHALGRTYPGGLNAFVAQMNLKAKLLGMTETHYVEPTGLSSHNQSSARDLATLVNVAHGDPLMRELTTSPSYAVEVGRRTLQFNTTNRLVKNPNWDIGLQKTGYISEAGRCLVMQTKIAGRKLIMVFLDSAGKFSRLGDAERVRNWVESLPALGSEKSFHAGVSTPSMK